MRIKTLFATLAVAGVVFTGASIAGGIVWGSQPVAASGVVWGN